MQDVKILKFDDDARQSVFAGVEKLANAVVSTLGPGGRKVLIEKVYGPPAITNDGVTVAKAIDLEDKFEQMGALLVREAASKTNDVAGDGTTTSTLLAYNLIKAAIKAIGSGLSVDKFSRAIVDYSKLIIEELRKQSTQIDASDLESVANIATISARDAELGKNLADVVNQVGKDGVITVEDGTNPGVVLEVVEGMRLDKGFVTPYFITDQERQEATVDNPNVIITDKKLNSFLELLPLLDAVIRSTGKKDLVIVADDVSGDALLNMLENKRRGLLNVLAIKAPGFGDNKKAILEDLATITGGTVILEELGQKFEDIAKEADKYVGTCKRVIATKENAVFVRGGGTKENIETRKATIKSQLEKSDSKFDKDRYSERLAKLSKGIAVVKVGAHTEVEQKDLRLRVEDAVSATKAALAEGIVSGGGTALLKASRTALKGVKTTSAEERMALDVLLDVGKSVIKKIADNVGESGDVVAENVSNRSEADSDYGYNALTREYCNTKEAGIIDPLKVVRVSLENAVSVAVSFASLGAAIANKPKPEKVNE